MGDRISIRQFAKLAGCDEKLVRRGVEQGRLTKGADNLLDADQACGPWRAKAPPKDKAPARPPKQRKGPVAPPLEVLPGESAEEAAERLFDASEEIPAYAVSLAKKEHFIALLRQLEFQEKSGTLVELEMAKSVLFETSHSARNEWLQWPSRVAPLIAADLDIDSDRLLAALSAHVHKQLEALSAGESAAAFST